MNQIPLRFIIRTNLAASRKRPSLSFFPCRIVKISITRNTAVQKTARVFLVTNSNTEKISTEKYANATNKVTAPHQDSISFFSGFLKAKKKPDMIRTAAIFLLLFRKEDLFTLLSISQLLIGKQLSNEFYHSIPFISIKKAVLSGLFF